MRYYSLVIHCYRSTQSPSEQDTSQTLSTTSGKSNQTFTSHTSPDFPCEDILTPDLFRDDLIQDDVYTSDTNISRISTCFWRLGTVTIDMFSVEEEDTPDMSSITKDNSSNIHVNITQETRDDKNIASAPNRKNTTSLSGIYVPCAIQHTNLGIVHLFRDRYELEEFTTSESLDPSYTNLGEITRKRSSSLSHNPSNGSASRKVDKKDKRKQKNESHHIEQSNADHDTRDETSSKNLTNAETASNDSERDTMIAVLAVPLYVTPHDFLRLMGASRLHLTHMRIIRDALPFRCMILLKFKTAEYAHSFYETFNGRPFNSFEPEICHLVFLRSVRVTWSTIPEDLYAFLISSGSNQKEIPSPSPIPQKQMLEIMSRTGPTVASMPPSNELPTCPVCLERMDASVTALLTIACHHTFHCHCLMKWRDSTCPVCRFSATNWIEEEHNNSAQKTSSLLGTASASSSSNQQNGKHPSAFTSAAGFGGQNECSECGAKDNLWICLICAHIGCGRYVKGHAHLHYELTQHVFALDLETQRVWDYVGDGYVHRLIQNKSDGKLVELPASTGMASRWGLDALYGSTFGGSASGKWVESSVGGIAPSQRPTFSSRTFGRRGLDHRDNSTKDSTREQQTKSIDSGQDGSDLLTLGPHTRSRSSPANAFVFSSEKPVSNNDNDPRTSLLGNLRRYALDTLDPETSLVTPFDTILSEKLEGLGYEYAQQLQAQLDTQRTWYERQLSKLEITSAEQLALMDTRLASLVHTQKEMEHRVALTLDQSKQLEKRLEKSQNLAKALHKDVTEERAFNAALRENQIQLEASIDQLKKEALQKDAKISDLEEQVRDLMVFLETQQKIMKSPMKDELVNASVVGVGESSSPSSSRTHGRKSKRK